MFLVEGPEGGEARDLLFGKLLPDLPPYFVMLVDGSVQPRVVSGCIDGRQGRKKCNAGAEPVFCLICRWRRHRQTARCKKLTGGKSDRHRKSIDGKFSVEVFAQG